MKVSKEERQRALEELEAMIKAGPPPVRRPSAEVLEWPKEPSVSAMEMMIRQQIEKALQKKVELEASRISFNKAPGDSDWSE
jgi:hypothetical protein